MKITLKELKLTNFKGTKSSTYQFNDNENYLHGANGSGKTTLADAYRWLLTGKDSSDRANFEIKPTNIYGNTIPKLENEVSALLDIDGRMMEFKRVNREKWVTKRGYKEEEFQGNETKFFIDEVPLSQKEFNSRIAMLITDEQFKMMTDPYYFNTVMSWQGRRKILTEMAGEISDDMVLTEFGKSHTKKENNFIKDLLIAKKSFQDRTKELLGKKKQAKEEKEHIPARIDEVNRNKPIPLSFDTIAKDIKDTKKQISEIDKLINDRQLAYETLDKQHEDKKKKLFETKGKLYEIEAKHDADYNAEMKLSDAELSTKQSELNELKKDLENLNNDKNALQKRIDNANSIIALKIKSIKRNQEAKSQLLEEWKAKNAEIVKFNKDDEYCPTCTQKLPEDKIESHHNEMLDSFNKHKQQALADIVKRAEDIKIIIAIEEDEVKKYESAKAQIESELIKISESKIPAIEQEIVQLNDAIEALSHNPKMIIKSVGDRIHDDKDYQILIKEIEKIQDSFKEYQPIDVSDLTSKRDVMMKELEALNKDAALEQIIKDAQVRIDELTNQEDILTQTIADYEAELYAIQEFIKCKMRMVQDAVNSLFTLVQFKMYRTQINGGEEPACDCLVNGIEYEKNLNTASKINAGIDVINALSKHYNLYTPLFIDGRESVTNIIETDTQVINLVVDDTCQKLRLIQTSKNNLITI